MCASSARANASARSWRSSRSGAVRIEPEQAASLADALHIMELSTAVETRGRPVSRRKRATKAQSREESMTPPR